MKFLCRGVVVALGFSIAGCGGVPLRVVEQLDDRNYGTVAIVAGSEVAVEKPRSPAAGPAAGAGAGVVEVGVNLIALALPYCLAGPPFCAVVLGTAAVATAPVMALGALIGGATADPRDAVLAARTTIARGLAELRPAKTVAALAFEMARTQTAFAVRLEDSVDAKALAERGVDTVLEVALTEVHFVSTREGRAFFAAKARSRLVRAGDAKLLEEYETGYGSESRTHAEWAAAGAQALRAAFGRAWREIAESVVAEHLLVVRNGGATLRAEVPAQRREVQFFPKIETHGGYAFVAAGSGRPLLRWESLDSLMARAPIPVQTAPRDVSYELRVYRATDGFSKMPGELVYARDGLLAPEHAIEVDLSSCGYYFWTVRAHFILGDRSRTTKFSSLRESQDDFEEGNRLFFSRSSLYFRFRASAEGACKD
jgi:hypothetical protein